MTDFTTPSHLRSARASLRRLKTQLDTAGCCQTSLEVRTRIGCLMGTVDALTKRLHALIREADAEARRRVAEREGRDAA